MTKIAILGASSHIAKSLIDYFWHYDRKRAENLCLYARAPDKVNQWLSAHQFYITNQCESISQFGRESYDAVINMVGTSNAALLSQLGEEVFHTAMTYDDLVLYYLRQYPQCCYLFLSSGAVYGKNFSAPVQQDSITQHVINIPSEIDWYGLSKFCIEAKHRALTQYSIVDIRVFGYFSRWVDLDHPFFLSSVVKCILSKEDFSTTTDDFWRDYVGAIELAQLIEKILLHSPLNTSCDIFSQVETRKSDLLRLLQQQFALNCKLSQEDSKSVPQKTHYYSLDRRALQWGYEPRRSSESLIVDEIAFIIARQQRGL